MTLIIFLILTIAEAIYLWSKWDEIQEYKEIGQEVASITGLDQNKKYQKVIQILGKLWNYAKPVFYALGIALLIANIIVAAILSTILGFIF